MITGMPSSIIDALKIAGTNNFTLIAFIVYLVINLVSVAIKKEKAGVRTTLILSVIALVSITCYRLATPKSDQPNQAGVITGNGNGLAAGTGNTVTVTTPNCTPGSSK
jgi:hypothetical protein